MNNSKLLKILILFLFNLLPGCDKKVTYADKTPKNKTSETQNNTEDDTPKSDDATIRDRFTPGPLNDNFTDEDDLKNKEDDTILSNDVIELNFAPAKIDSRTETFDLQSNTITTEITMKNDYEDITLENSFRQSAKIWQIEQFTQGSKQQNVSETFGGDKIGVVDILIVMDNSPSMYEEQQNFGDRLEPLLSEIDDSDWQIGVVDTDPPENQDQNTCLRGFLKKGEQDTVARFKEIISVGIQGSGIEKGILAATNAIQCKDNWLRPNASLAVLIVSDEDNCSREDFHCAGKPFDKASYLLDELSKKYSLGNTARVYGLFHHPSLTDAQCPTSLNIGKTYEEAVSKSDGAWGSICSNDYTDVLKTISLNIKNILRDQFTMRLQPNPGSVKAILNGVEINSFTESGRTITLDSPLKSSSTLVVNYSTIDSYLDRKDLQFIPDPSTFELTVNGSKLNANQYQLSGKTVIFNQNVPENASVQLRYQKLEDLPKTFDIGPTEGDTALTVKVNGTLETAVSFEATSGKLTFAKPPEANAYISVVRSYKKSNGPILKYPVATSKQGIISLKDKANQEDVPYTYESGHLVFSREDFTNNRKLLLTAAEKPEGSKFTLSNKVFAQLPYSVELSEIDKSKKQCESPNLNLIDQTEKTEIEINCDLTKITKIDVQYSFIIALEKTFPLGIPSPESYRYDVYIDDQKSDKFKISDSNVTIEATLNPETKIKVLATPLN